jgi:aminocarboxymuconate-semialdehyde decarboxylase
MWHNRLRGDKMKIDIFPHIMPEKYFKALRKKAKRGTDSPRVEHSGPKEAVAEQYSAINQLDDRVNIAAIDQLEVRLRLSDRYPDVLQVLTVSTPPLETLVTASDAIELAKIANDELAELAAKYPDKFIAAVACLPLSDIDAAMKEADRAITQLHLRGVQIFTNINGEPLDEPKFRPLYELMAKHDLPIWIHPWGQPISASGSLSAKPIRGFGWPFETTSAMQCLVQTGIFEDCPNIKFITHHCGGMVPFFGRRMKMGGTRGQVEDFHKFYADTALYGNTSGLMCGYAYFGAEHLLFGTDMPFSGGEGYGHTRETILSVEQMDIPVLDKDKIFEGNARRLLKLSV